MKGHVAEQLFDAAARNGDQLALGARTEDGGWRTLTYRETAAAVRRLAHALISEQLLPSETVTIMAPGGPEWFVAHLAVLTAAGVSVPVDDRSSDEEALAIIRETDSRIVVVGGRRAQATIARVRSRLPGLRLVITLDDHLDALAPGAADGPAVVPLARLEQLPYDLATAAEARHRAETWSGEDIATVRYRSTSTGHLRGVVLTHEAVLYPLRALVDLLGVRTVLTHVMTVPIANDLQQFAALSVLLRGGTVWTPAPDDRVADVLVELRPNLVVSSPQVLDEVVRTAVAEVAGRTGNGTDAVARACRVADEVQALHRDGRPVPTQLAMARRAAEGRVLAPLRARLGGPKRLTLIGGQGLVARDLFSVLEHTGQVPCTGWGSPETSTVVTFNPLSSGRVGSVGRPLPGSEVRIASDGEVLVRGPGSMRGYYGRPAETREALEDGWVRTGQPGRLDDEGYLYLTSRLDDTILMSSLVTTSARPIERVLEQAPVIEEAVIAGEGRPVLTALVHPAVDVLRTLLGAGPATPQAELLADPRAVRLVGDAIRRANETLPEEQRLHGFRLVATSLGAATPVTGAAMPRRQRALQDHAALVEDMYADLEAVRKPARGA